MELNELTLAQDIKRILEENFDVESMKIASNAGTTRAFNIGTFSLMSFDDEIVKNDDFGFLYVDSIKCDTQTAGAHPLESIKKTYTVRILVVIVDRGTGLPTQIAIAREGLISALVYGIEDSEFFGFSLTKFETIEPFPIDISEQEDDTRYMCCGINAEFNTGFR